MTRVLIAAAGEDGGLFDWRPGDAAPRRLAAAPGLVFALPLPDGRVLALSGSEEGRIRLFAPDGDGLRESDVAHSGAAEPCHAILLADDLVLVVGYGDETGETHPTALTIVSVADDALGSVAIVPTAGAGARVVPDRQRVPHLHFALDLGDGTVLVADLGSDRLRRFRVDAAGAVELGSCATPPGSGPRHLAILDGTLVASAELSGELIAAPLSAVLTGAADWVGIPASDRAVRSARSDGTDPVSYPSDLAVLDDGMVAVANRGADTVTIVRVRRDDATGGISLEHVDERPVGAWPQRLLRIDDRLLVAARNGDLVDEVPVGGALAAGAMASAPLPLARPMWLAATAEEHGDDASPVPA